jgi:hypothetical protein
MFRRINLKQETGAELAAGRSAPRADLNIQRWPIVRAYVPAREEWRVSGTGSAGIVRQQPDGQFVTAFFTISLMQGGMDVIFGAEGSTLAEIEAGIREMRGTLPPMEPGPPQLAARYIWGAYAWSMADGQSWSRLLTSRYLGLVPRLPGTRLAWLDQFVGERGLVPSGLIEAIAQNPVPENLPADKEVAIATIMEFDLTGTTATIVTLQRDEDFVELPREKTAVQFHWMRESSSRPGQRVPYGLIRIERGKLIAQASTLSLAALCVTKLNETLAGRLKLRHVEWHDPASLPGRLLGAAPFRKA